jgi:hypothetical protein
LWSSFQEARTKSGRAANSTTQTIKYPLNDRKSSVSNGSRDSWNTAVCSHVIFLMSLTTKELRRR